MIALLSLLGLGLVFSAFSGGDDDDQPRSGGTGEEGFTEGRDVVLDQSYLPAVQADAADLVREGEFTQSEVDGLLNAIEFVAGEVNIDTGVGDDYVVTGAGDDTISAGAGNDLVVGAAGDDRIDLGADQDVYGIDQRAIETGDDFIAFPNGDFDLLAQEEVIEGGNDTILGGSGLDAISDSFGVNFVNGQQGDDFISVVDDERGGAVTPDRVLGGFGNDTLYIDEGDSASGNQGRDDFNVDLFDGVGAGYDVVTITDFQRGVDSLELEGAAGLLSLNGAGDSPVTVADLADGSGAVVSIGGIEVVRVLGGAGMTIADVRLSS